MFERFSQFSWEEYNGVQYLTREITYTDKFGDSHRCNIADEALSTALWNDAKQDFDNTDIDNQYCCYAPVSALLIKDDQALAQWLEENVTEMELK